MLSIRKVHQSYECVIIISKMFLIYFISYGSNGCALAFLGGAEASASPSFALHMFITRKKKKKSASVIRCYTLAHPWLRPWLKVQSTRETLFPRLKCVCVCVCARRALKLTSKVHFELQTRPNDQIHTKHVKTAGLESIHLNTVHVLK